MHHTLLQILRSLLLLLYLYAIFIAEILQSLHIVHLLVLHNKGNHTAGLSAAKAFEDTLGGGDGETWSLLLMEGTAGHIVSATALEGDKISHNLLYSGALQNSVNC